MYRTQQLPVKSTRHSSYPATPFGAGILPVQPRTRRTRFEPSLDDRSWAAQHLGAGNDCGDVFPDELLIPVPEFGICGWCGDRVPDLCSNGLCDRCDLQASESSTGYKAW